MKLWHKEGEHDMFKIVRKRPAPKAKTVEKAMPLVKSYPRKRSNIKPELPVKGTKKGVTHRVNAPCTGKRFQTKAI